MTPRVLVAALCVAFPVFSIPAQDAAAKDPAPQGWTKTQQRGVDFLLGKQEHGVFSVRHGERSFPHAGFTSLAIAAIQSKPRALRTEAEQAVIDKGLTWVIAQQNDDGSIGRSTPNYTTCAAVMALSRWHDDKRMPVLKKAQRYVLAIQKFEQNGTARSDVEYGGVGYGSKGERSDLSNMQFAIAALRESGLETDHEAFQRALVFLQRTQNLKSVNDLSGKLDITTGEDATAKLSVGDDGGAVYYPGESPAGYVVHPDGSATPRSYGSMTYALLKTYTLCGVKKDDPRVQAAVKWIRGNWTVEENPGVDPKLGENERFQGLFYYYMLMGQALDATGIDTIAQQGGDGGEVKVDWRKQLRAQLEGMQRDDGAWVNDKNGRWYENLDVLCTCYALIALGYCGG